MDLIVQIKEKNNILEIAKELIPDLKKSGSVYIGTIRDEKTPALTIYPSTQSWCHFAGDTTLKGRTGGDVIDLVEYVKGCDTKEAIKFLAERCGIKLRQMTEADLQKINQAKEVNQVLQEVANFYHTILIGNLKAEKFRKYLKERGFEEETLKQNLIGVSGSNDLLFQHLVKRGFKKDVMLSTGLVTKSGQDYFQYRIIFPIIKNSRVVYMTGRKTEQTPSNEFEHGKYKHLPTSEWIKNDYFYNEDVLIQNNEIILCEGIPDCLTLQQWQLPAIAILGNKVKDDLIQKLKKIKTVYIAFDPDGKSDPLKTAQDIGSQAKIVSLPQGDKDINDLAQDGLTKAGFESLIESSKTVLEYQLNLIPKDSDRTKLPEILESILTQLARLSEENEAKADAFLRHVISSYFKLTAREIEVYKRTIKQIKIKLQEKNIKQEAEKADEPKIIVTEAEKDEALKFLKDPNLIELISQDLTKLGVVGEEENKLVVYLAATSRKLTKGTINLEIRASSSTGKSFITNKVLELIPPEDQVNYTRITAKFLDYLPENALEHKVLVIMERSGTEDADYSIRMIADDSKPGIELGYLKKNPKTGDMETVSKVVKGPVVLIQTTTNLEANPENESRSFEVYLDESNEQKQRVHDKIKYDELPHLAVTKTEKEKIIKRHHSAQRLLETLPVAIPYSPLIEFPTSSYRSNRDLKRFLSFIKSSALLHQYQRKSVDIHGSKHIVANLIDYAIAHQLCQKVLLDIFSDINPSSR